MLLAALLLFFISLTGHLSIILNQLEIPGAIIRGESVWLHCNYELEEDQLYSVKWYKNNVEFFRYLPSDNPPGQKYDLLGLFIDLQKSNHTHVYLHRTDVNSEGTFGCEVSTEAPSFLTVKAEKDMRVYVLLQTDPMITNIQPYYQMGDPVNLSCTAGPSKPASSLKWYLNSEEVPKAYEMRLPTERHFNGLYTSRSKLVFSVKRKHFLQGLINLRCSASISQIFSISSEEVLIGFRGGVRSSNKGHSPVIYGLQERYRVDDVVDLNCTSGNTSSPVDLRWFINDKQAPPDYVTKHSFSPLHTTLVLHYKIKNHHFVSEELRLRCTALLSKVVTVSSQVNLYSDNYVKNPGIRVSEVIGTDKTQGCPSCCWILLLLIILRIF